MNFRRSAYAVAVTVLEAIQRGTDFLARKGVESPRLQVESLLAQVLGMPRLSLYLGFERTLSDGEVSSLREWIRRRAAREPLQHILGSTSFCGLEIKVNECVLVPRPETELLAERARAFLSDIDSAAPVALDFGTGSGCLAIALAVHCERAQVHALDISNEAVAVARQNAAANRVSDRIHFHAGNGFEALESDLSFNLIVSNPPYIARPDLEALAPEVRDHDPRVALDGGPDGLDFYRRLAGEAGGRLLTGGRLMLEIGDGQEARVREILEAHKWIVERVDADYSGRPRVLVARPG